MDGVIVNEVLHLKAGGLFGSPVLDTLKPAEQDANAAAAVYLKQHHPEAVDTILRHPNLSQLARSNVGPEDMDTLLKRTICFLYLYRDVCAEWANHNGFSFDGMLWKQSKRAAQIWRGLDADGPSESGGD